MTTYRMRNRKGKVGPMVWVEVLSDIGREDDVDEAFVVVVVDKRDLRIIEERRIVEVEQGRLSKVQPHRSIGQCPATESMKGHIASGVGVCETS